MQTKQLLVGTDIHQQVKVAAALSGQSIREFVESALVDRLRSFSLPLAVETSTETVKNQQLVDSKTPYTTEAD